MGELNRTSAQTAHSSRSRPKLTNASAIEAPDSTAQARRVRSKGALAHMRTNASLQPLPCDKRFVRFSRPRPLQCCLPAGYSYG